MTYGDLMIRLKEAKEKGVKFKIEELYRTSISCTPDCKIVNFYIRHCDSNSYVVFLRQDEFYCLQLLNIVGYKEGYISAKADSLICLGKPLENV